MIAITTNDVDYHGAGGGDDDIHGDEQVADYSVDNDRYR